MISSVNMFPGSLWLRHTSICLCCLWVSLFQNASQNANYTFFSPSSIYYENLWSPVYMFLSLGSWGKEPFVMHSVSSLKVTAWWVCFYVSVLLSFFFLAKDLRDSFCWDFSLRHKKRRVNNTYAKHCRYAKSIFLMCCIVDTLTSVTKILPLDK